MNDDRVRSLSFWPSRLIGIGNILLALLLALYCIIPVISWLLVFLYTIADHPFAAFLLLVTWLGGICSTFLFVRVALLCLVERRWHLSFQIFPFIGGTVLFLIAYYSGGWKIICQLLGWG